MSEPRVELLWWAECPSFPEALAELGEEMRGLGLDPDSIEVREMRSEEQAASEGFPGSPTIRIEGRDIQAPGGEPIELTCRVYRLRDGRFSATPDRADVREALLRAIEGGGR